MRLISKRVLNLTVLNLLVCLICLVSCGAVDDDLEEIEIDNNRESDDVQVYKDSKDSLPFDSSEERESLIINFTTKPSFESLKDFFVRNPQLYLKTVLANDDVKNHQFNTTSLKYGYLDRVQKIIEEHDNNSVNSVEDKSDNTGDIQSGNTDSSQNDSSTNNQDTDIPVIKDDNKVEDVAINEGESKNTVVDETKGNDKDEDEDKYEDTVQIEPEFQDEKISLIKEFKSFHQDLISMDKQSFDLWIELLTSFNYDKEIVIQQGSLDINNHNYSTVEYQNVPYALILPFINMFYVGKYEISPEFITCSKTSAQDKQNALFVYYLYYQNQEQFDYIENSINCDYLEDGKIRNNNFQGMFDPSYYNLSKLLDDKCMTLARNFVSQRTCQDSLDKMFRTTRDASYETNYIYTEIDIILEKFKHTHQDYEDKSLALNNIRKILEKQKSLNSKIKDSANTSLTLLIAYLELQKTNSVQAYQQFENDINENFKSKLSSCLETCNPYLLSMKYDQKDRSLSNYKQKLLEDVLSYIKFIKNPNQDKNNFLDKQDIQRLFMTADVTVIKDLGYPVEISISSKETILDLSNQYFKNVLDQKSEILEGIGPKNFKPADVTDDDDRIILNKIRFKIGDDKIK